MLPLPFCGSPCFPNPFNPTTTIEFSMPQAAGVTVRVYNVLGQVVKTLVNGTLPPGIHRVQWDATDD
ncbi:MAG: T9SS type A sorting domain-containing protein, partial [Bacteroidetes bacterium]|nr:T9SS type A sorting domain-containing protein [Bacteroidota bacterium]